MKTGKMKKSLLHSMSFCLCLSRKILMVVCMLSYVILFSGCEYLFPSLRSDKITSEEAAVYLEKHKDDNEVVLLDIRTKTAFDSVRIQNSVNIDFSLPDFPDTIGKLDKEKRYILVDQNGRRSAMAFELMKEQRFPKIHYIIGGMNEWTKNNFPVQK